MCRHRRGLQHESQRLRLARSRTEDRGRRRHLARVLAEAVARHDGRAVGGVAGPDGPAAARARRRAVARELDARDSRTRVAAEEAERVEVEDLAGAVCARMSVWSRAAETQRWGRVPCRPSQRGRTRTSPQKGFSSDTLPPVTAVETSTSASAAAKEPAGGPGRMLSERSLSAQ